MIKITKKTYIIDMVIIHLFPSLCSKVVFENLKFVVAAKEHVVGRYNTSPKLGEMILMFMVYLMSKH